MILTDLLYLFLTAFVTFLLYPIWIDFVYKFQMGEEIRKDGPKSHLAKQGTPTMGGFVFILTVALVTFIFNRSRTQTLFPVFVASLAGLFGIIEDFSKVYKKSGLPSFFRYHFPALFKPKLPNFGIFKIITHPWEAFKEFWRVVGSNQDRGLKTYQKFLIQGFIGGFVAYWTYFKLGWDYIWFPLIGDVHIGILYPLCIFVLFVVILNFIAFSDGIDGLVGGLSIIAFLAYWVIASQLGYNSLAAFCATMVGALLPFLYFNFFPARIFMGNVGSHVLGATLVTLAVIMHKEVALFLICGVMILDGLSSPLQQFSVKLTKKRLFRFAPVHHHFELLGWPETKVTLRFWLFGALFAFLGIFVALL